MPTILIVDDEEADLLGLAAMLEPEGHRVLMSRNADEALETFLSERVHLVVTDIVMPGRGGLSLISAIKNVDPAAAIVAISGKSPGQLEASKIFGAAEVLTKPIDKTDLLTAIDSAMAGAQGGGAR